MKYVANPVVVNAFQISSIGAKGDRGCLLHFDNGDCGVATTEMTSRMTPKVGDYWVIQYDGYTYLNPKEVFERKYRPLPENVEAAF